MTECAQEPFVPDKETVSVALRLEEPLAHAMWRHNYDQVRSLVYQKADINQYNRVLKNTPLGHTLGGDHKMLITVLDCGAIPYPIACRYWVAQRFAERYWKPYFLQDHPSEADYSESTRFKCVQGMLNRLECASVPVDTQDQDTLQFFMEQGCLNDFMTYQGVGWKQYGYDAICVQRQLYLDRLLLVVTECIPVKVLVKLVLAYMYRDW